MGLAYGVVLTLIDLIDRIPAHHARFPSLFSMKQLGEIESIKEKACFIQNYLEVHSLGLDDSRVARDLKRQILEVSVEATNIVETHILDDMEASSSSEKINTSSSIDTLSIQFKNEQMESEDELIEKTGCRCFSFSKRKTKRNTCSSIDNSTIQFEKTQRHLHQNKDVSEVMNKVLHSLDSIIKDMMEIEDLKPLTSTHSSSVTHTTMYDRDYTHVVGFEDRLIQMMDKLTGGKPDLQVIPITGMGGIGKTTLAQTIYDNSLIVHSFDIRAWVTISQLYNIEQVLFKLLSGFGIVEQKSSKCDHLGLRLHQHLYNRKYLIIVDDLWNHEAWDKLQIFLPNTNGSRIIVTTRLNEVANYVGSSNNLHELNLLDEDNSWHLLCLNIFGHKGCSPHLELEKVGKEIARGCKGLPLAIVVIGGLLRKSEMSLVSWEYVAHNVNKIISSKDNDCLDILLLSYRHLPIHLRPCFLYMGTFPEDKSISVSRLVNMWVAEGFLKSSKLKTLEEVAEEYLMDLIERHLIMISDWTSLGTMKTCKVHDLLRDLCLREAAKEGYISINKITFFSLWGNVEPLKYNFIVNKRYVRVLKKIRYVRNDEDYINLLNVRFLRTRVSNIVYYRVPDIFSLVHRLWNLQTLVIESITGEIKDLTVPIWKMPHLRHFTAHSSILHNIFLEVPRPGDSVLENLQTLKGIDVKFEYFEEIFSRIPNVKALRLRCYTGGRGEYYYFKSYGHLLKLQSLTLHLNGYGAEEFIQKSVFPDSLKKLKLIHPYCSLDEISKRSGLLPHLQKLTLRCTGFTENRDWNPVEGQFLQLRVLKLDYAWRLVNWNAESVHFPVLEHLHLRAMYGLEEIPYGIGEIETLKSITLKRCGASIVDSAKELLEEQKSNGNENFRLTINNVTI